MKRRTFEEYLEKRLNKDEIAEINEQALKEKNALQALQDGVASALENYMKKLKKRDCINNYTHLFFN